jgi:MoaD family protein
MVRVEVTLFGALAKIAGEKTLELEASTLGDAVDGLIERCGEKIRKRLFDEKGRIRRFVNIYVNGKDMRFLQNLGTPLKDGDKISIIPAVGGG